jgi:hypothetical protein
LRRLIIDSEAFWPLINAGDTEGQMRFFGALIASLVATGMLYASSAVADGQMTQGDLYTFCVATDETSQTACRFYVLGVVQGIEVGDSSYMDSTTRRLVERKKTIYCLPDGGLSQSEMVAIVKGVLQSVLTAYPKDKELPAQAAVLAAMNRKFPCPK